MSESQAFQDQIPDNHCFGCGPVNAGGLQIKSYWDGDETICTWHPASQHAAGPEHILNGGIIATLIDCHTICTAIADAYRREGREMSELPLIWYVTGSLNVKYLKPSYLSEPVILRAKIEEVSGKKTTVSCTVHSKGELTAEGKVLAIRVPPEWRASI